jgi:predicted nucleic acid-binding protein
LFFDTSAAIAYLHGDQKLKDAGNEGIVISTVTVYELLWAAKRKSHRALEAVEVFLNGCVLVPFGADIARRSARIKTELMAAGKDKPMADIIIAASAEQEGLKFFTMDNDFKDIGRFAEIDLHLI